MTDAHLSDSDIVNAVEKIDGKIALSMFDGSELSIFSELDDMDPAKLVGVVRSLLSKDLSERDEISRHLLAHFEMMEKAIHNYTQILEELNVIPPTLSTIWQGIKLGSLELKQVTGTAEDTSKFNPEESIYVVLDLNVPWEPEHSVIVSWKNGSALVKVGENGPPAHNLEQLGVDHHTCIFHCPSYGLCTRPK